MTRWLALAAIVLNTAAILAWMWVNPPADYERRADRDLRQAHAALRKESPDRTHAMYHQVITDYPRSTSVEEARFYAARTAFLGLGQFQEAEREFAEYLAMNPKHEENRREAEKYLTLIREREDIPAEQRDEALWEYVQAMTENSQGRHREALTRLEWLVETYKATKLGQAAEALRQQVATKVEV